MQPIPPTTLATGRQVELIERDVVRAVASFEIDDDGCWVWTGRTDRGGYGKLRISRDGAQTDLIAHRVMWAITNREWPVETLDHLCRNRLCVNPDHLEDVDADTNKGRGLAARIKNGLVDHCINGHKYTPENTYRTPAGSFVCRTCSREASMHYYYQRKDKVGAAH